MKLHGKVNFFIIFISIISLGTLKNANASLQDQYRSQTCTFDNAPFQDPKYKDQRYCINNTNNRVYIVWEDGQSDIAEGFIGGQESVKLGGDYGSYYLIGWGIDSNKLIQYSCPTNDHRNCSGNVEIDKEAFKR